MDVVSPQKNQNKKSQLDSQKRQNIIFGALLFVGFSAIVLGVFQISGTIGSPLVGSDGEDTQNALTNSDSEYDQLVFLKEKDTDQDGLNDYDELYIYGTSPYVADSDSDNISDKDELDSGNDPNCPKGEVCVITTVATEPASDLTNTVVTTTTTNELSAGELRDTLKQLGAPANIVDAMDDETLRTVYEDTVVETGIDPQELTNQTDSLAPADSAGQEITLDALQQLDAAQIRQLLIGSGVSEADLSQVDDETLELLYYQALQEELY
ncbi:hypothetical protein KKB10_02140 [Patescibacteria group bacterium]|nr:hypothetical protein [Patescibacteria group bacterium]MBU1075304.1 hypothetical protein [Patescibacteria group bacterium]MBU1952331.1 hypothetical protein [Patescibacteria group bacterium]